MASLISSISNDLSLVRVGPPLNWIHNRRKKTHLTNDRKTILLYWVKNWCSHNLNILKLFLTVNKEIYIYLIHPYLTAPLDQSYLIINSLKFNRAVWGRILMDHKSDPPPYDIFCCCLYTRVVPSIARAFLRSIILISYRKELCYKLQVNGLGVSPEIHIMEPLIAAFWFMYFRNVLHIVVVFKFIRMLWFKKKKSILSKPGQCKEFCQIFVNIGGNRWKVQLVTT